jgi:hypothetical protein
MQCATDNLISIEKLFLDGKINDEEQKGKLSQIGLENLLCMYCSNGKKFSMDHFVAFLDKRRVDDLVALTTYNVLQKWRREFE